MNHFAVQRNLVNKNDLTQIRDACESLRLDYSEFTLIPFSNTLPDFGGAFYYGSTTILKHNKPGIFYTQDEFTMTRLVAEYGDLVLNAELGICDISDIAKIKAPTFVKPNICTKRFVGRVFEPEELQSWSVPDDIADWDGKVVFAAPVNIEAEWRLWIVNKTIVAGSQYRENGRLKLASNLNHAAISCAEQCIERYCPARAFVLDICSYRVGEFKLEYKAVEVNSINSSGFYAANVFDIVAALAK